MHLLSKSGILDLIDSFWNKNKRGVVEILGPTSCGKTTFSIEIAKKFTPAEIISVDSRQIYKEINIASVKITSREQQGIPHWGLDLISPEQIFSAYDFQQYAFGKIDEILHRQAHPILCGGTMLWLDALSENYVFSEKGKKSNRKEKPRYPFLKIGIDLDRNTLYERINKRCEALFQSGLIKETQYLLRKYALSKSAFTSFGYQEIKDSLDGKISLDRALELNQQRNRNYAKRQLTWWRGRHDIFWVKGDTL